MNMCQQFSATILLNILQLKVSNISRQVAQSMRKLGNSSSANRPLMVSNNGRYALHSACRSHRNPAAILWRNIWPYCQSSARLVADPHSSLEYNRKISVKMWSGNYIKSTQ